MMGKLTVLLLLLVIGVLFCSAKSCQVCCERKEKLQSHGRDADLKLIEVDMGECEAVYSNHTNWTAPSGSDCSRKCEPKSYDLRTISNRTGPVNIYTVRSCSANRHHCIMGCMRKPEYVYMFPYSKYETKVDVGKCAGQCGNRTGSFLGCVATRRKQVAVEGPNGAQVIDTIETCSCQNTTCYREDYFESFWQKVDPETNNTTTRRKQKVINVGRCVGMCSGIYIQPRCHMNPITGKCVKFPLIPQPARCRPTMAEVNSFTDDLGVKMNILAVVECGCISG